MVNRGGTGQSYIGLSLIFRVGPMDELCTKPAAVRLLPSEYSSALAFVASRSGDILSVVWEIKRESWTFDQLNRHQMVTPRLRAGRWFFCGATDATPLLNLQLRIP